LINPHSFSELTSIRSSEKSETIRDRVIKARQIQAGRFQASKSVYSNSQMGSKMLRNVCLITDEGRQLLKTAMERLGLSARAYDRILKVSRTIADLDSSTDIRTEHLAEAIQYRSLDREGWAG
jgi:magnesium chelatase family protein